MTLRFRKKKEAFICAHCEVEVSGSGYTNHCPRCLWSRHVDIFPGDRAEECGGMMEPIGLEERSGKRRVTTRCVVCGEERVCRLSPEDDFESVLAILRKRVGREMGGDEP